MSNHNMILTYVRIDDSRYEREVYVSSVDEAKTILKQYEGVLVWYEVTDDNGNELYSSC